MSAQAIPQPAAGPALRLREQLEQLPHAQHLSNLEAEAIYALGRQLSLQGQHERALRIYTVATQYKPAQAKYWRAKGLSLMALARYAEAMAALHHVTLLEPGRIDNSLSIAECLLHTGAEPAGLAMLEAITLAAEARGVPSDPAAARARALRDLLARTPTQEPDHGHA